MLLDAAPPATWIGVARVKYAPKFRAIVVTDSPLDHGRTYCIPEPTQSPSNLYEVKNKNIQISPENFHQCNISTHTLVPDGQSLVNLVFWCRVTDKSYQCPRRFLLCI